MGVDYSNKVIQIFSVLTIVISILSIWSLSDSLVPIKNHATPVEHTGHIALDISESTILVDNNSSIIQATKKTN